MKKFLVVIGLLILMAQLIRPARNQGVSGGPKSFEKCVAVPGPVLSVLKRACYDCHSNRTAYPWYANVQPVGWWLDHHVKEGKEELNFDEFAAYDPDKSRHKLQESADVIKEGEMPLSSYLLIHKGAKLSDADTATVLAWMRQYSPER
ncbi:heme-binding domain-containing protein [Arcticibacter sp. MXS-1]|uniref:heme-binding domain-containing protein n=1 Tax=Arcticibacter sp. MXS-1 TaxID=3341726 RepID=UPI0035A99983